MERESAVREILQSIGPMFPEDAQRARAERRAGRQVEAAPAQADAQGEPGKIKMTPAPKPVLASQVEGPAVTRTRVADLAEVLEHLTALPSTSSSPTSVRDAVPQLVRPLVPDVDALQAALDARAEAKAAVASEPVVTAEPEVTATAAEAPTEATVAEVVEPISDAVIQPEAIIEPAVETAEQTSLVEAVAEAIFPVTAPPADEAPAAGEAVVAAEPAPPPVDVPEAPAPLMRRAPPPQKIFRARKRPTVDTTPAAEVAAEPAASEPAPAPMPVAPEPQPASSTVAEEDELVRQVRTHRVDLLDVDEQLARLEAQIDAERAEMARHVATLEEKVAYRARLVRLRTATERFVTGLQARSEPRAAARRGNSAAQV